jgi:hypothetical protein
MEGDDFCGDSLGSKIRKIGEEEVGGGGDVSPLWDTPPQTQADAIDIAVPVKPQLTSSVGSSLTKVRFSRGDSSTVFKCRKVQ